VEIAANNVAIAIHSNFAPHSYVPDGFCGTLHASVILLQSLSIQAQQPKPAQEAGAPNQPLAMKELGQSSLHEIPQQHNQTGLWAATLETIIFNQGDSVAATEFVSFTPKGPKAVFGNGVENITGLGSGSDKVDINFAPPAAIIDDPLLILSSNTILEVGTITELKGTYTFNNNKFLFEGTGSDYLYVVGGENQTVEQTLTSSSNMFVSVGSKLSIGDFV
jgi:hypothetical protein